MAVSQTAASWVASLNGFTRPTADILPGLRTGSVGGMSCSRASQTSNSLRLFHVVPSPPFDGLVQGLGLNRLRLLDLCPYCWLEFYISHFAAQRLTHSNSAAWRRRKRKSNLSRSHEAPGTSTGLLGSLGQLW